MVSKKLDVILIFGPLQVRFFFSGASSQSPSFIFCSLSIICLHVGVFLLFILLHVLLASWICGWTSDINLGKSSVITASNAASLPFFLLPLIVPLCINYTFCSCPTGVRCSLLLFSVLFLLDFQFFF